MLADESVESHACFSSILSISWGWCFHVSEHVSTCQNHTLSFWLICFSGWVCSIICWRSWPDLLSPPLPHWCCPLLVAGAQTSPLSQAQRLYPLGKRRPATSWHLGRFFFSTFPNPSTFTLSFWHHQFVIIWLYIFFFFCSCSSWTPSHHDLPPAPSLSASFVFLFGLEFPSLFHQFPSMHWVVLAFWW